jgi:hypothetical protein
MKKWPADRVERKSVESLVPYARNARTHSDEQVAQIAESIERYGFTIPVLADEEGRIIAGHGRVMAANRLGLADVPVMTAEGWTEAERRAYGIIDIKLALNAGWDDELLRVEFSELEGLGFDLGQLGFSPPELAGIRDVLPVGESDPDDAPAAPAEPVATRGDLWALGRHLLLCGDATSADDTQKVLGGATPHLMVTDPPYGVDYDPDWRNHAVRADGTFIGARAVGLITNDTTANWADAWKWFPGTVAYVWHAGVFADLVACGLREAGLIIRCQIIWAKQHFIIGRGDYHWQHEPCWYAVRKGERGNWQGDRKQSTLWSIHSQIGWESARPDNEGDRPQRAKADRVHEASDREQFQAWRRGLRAILRQRHDDNCRRNDRPEMPRDRN